MTLVILYLSPLRYLLKDMMIQLIIIWDSTHWCAIVIFITVYYLETFEGSFSQISPFSTVLFIIIFVILFLQISKSRKSESYCPQKFLAIWYCKYPNDTSMVNAPLFMCTHHSYLCSISLDSSVILCVCLCVLLLVKGIHLITWSGSGGSYYDETFRQTHSLTSSAAS